MTNMTETTATRKLVISGNSDMTADELTKFVEQHLGYVSVAHGFHLAFVGEVRVSEASNGAGELSCSVNIDFTEYAQAVREKFEVEDDSIGEAMDSLMEHLAGQMVSGSPVRKDNTQLIEGIPELSLWFTNPSYDVVPAPAHDVIEDFKATTSGVHNVELYEMFMETLEMVRQDERAKADARVEAVKREAEENILVMTQATSSIVEILTKENKSLVEKNENLSKIAGIPKFRRTGGTRIVKRNTARSTRL